MLQISEVKELPRAMSLAGWSQKEWDDKEGAVLVRRSKHVWSLTDDGELLMAAGLHIPTLMSVPELWVLLCRDFRKHLRRNITFAREYFEEVLDVYPRIEVHVDSNFGAGRKFAEVMGFIELTSEILSDGRDYIVYEVRRGN